MNYCSAGMLSMMMGERNRVKKIVGGYPQITIWIKASFCFSKLEVSCMLRCVLGQIVRILLVFLVGFNPIPVIFIGRESNKCCATWQEPNQIFLTYQAHKLKSVGYSNSDYHECVDTRKSTSSFVFMFGGGAISWKNKKQVCVAQSRMETSM